MSIVKPGTIWADNYPGNEGRTIRVTTVDNRYAYCQVLTIRAASQRYLDQHGEHLTPHERASLDVRGRNTRVLLTAFRSGPARTGYSPVEAEAKTSG